MLNDAAQKQFTKTFDTAFAPLNWKHIEATEGEYNWNIFDQQIDNALWKERWSEQTQTAWIEYRLPVLMAKQNVIGIFWSHSSDAHPYEFPHAGLLDSEQTPKEALQNITTSQ